jgi:glycine amidinotransferase
MQKERNVNAGCLHDLRPVQVQESSTRVNRDDAPLRDDSLAVSREGNAACPVNSWNEWDPLEEVIVGRLDGAVVPPFHVSVTQNSSRSTGWLHRLVAGHRYPQWLARRAQAELDGFIRLLEAESIRVRRPEPIDLTRRLRTRLWSSKGFCLACPRDVYLVVGDEILETPTCWRSRQFEGDAYRELFKEYFNGGARWTAAPRPQLPDQLFDESYREPEPDEPVRYLINEFEPVFDAADIARCGRDLFVIRSNVTNESGIRWLRRHLGSRGFRVHELKSRCRGPMHIDTTFVPLAPGRVMVNPEYLDVDHLPPILKRWDILIPPPPDQVHDLVTKLSLLSHWGGLNVLMLDERTAVVDASQPTLHRALKDWGFEPLPLPFRSYGPFGGAFHCATLDTRRRGTLQDYFQS